MEPGYRLPVFGTRGQWSAVWLQLIILLPLKLVGGSECWAHSQSDCKKWSVKSDHVDNDNDKPIKLMKLQALPDKGVKSLGGWDQLKKRHPECRLINLVPARPVFFWNSELGRGELAVTSSEAHLGYLVDFTVDLEGNEIHMSFFPYPTRLIYKFYWCPLISSDKVRSRPRDPR